MEYSEREREREKRKKKKKKYAHIEQSREEEEEEDKKRHSISYVASRTGRVRPRGENVEETTDGDDFNKGDVFFKAVFFDQKQQQRDVEKSLFFSSPFGCGGVWRRRRRRRKEEEELFGVFGTAEALRRYSPIEDRNIREASGLVKSKLNSDVKTHKHAIFWTHNDSGDRARVFAIRVGGGAPGSSNVVEETADVSVVAEVTILNAGARDWEDLALWQDRDDGMKQKLCAGDIGSYRGEVVIYCFPEPKLSSNYKNVSFTKKEYLKVSYTEKIRLRYPSNEKHDAETLLVDPHTAQFLIVTKKNNNKGGLYVSEPIRSLSRSTSNALKFIRKIKLYGTSSGATGGDISWSGKKIVLKSYGRYVYEYTRQSFFDPNRDPNVRGLGEWDPSEALALDNDVPDENEIWTLNEGSRSSLKRYRLR